MIRTRSLFTRLSLGPVPHEGEADDAAKKLQEQIAAEVEKATTGLKNNNKAILEEKKALKEQYDGLMQQFDSLGGADGVKKLMQQRAEMLKTEEGKLLTEGKHQEWLELKTSALRKDHENQMKALAEQMASKDTTVSTLTQKLHRKTLSVEVAHARTEAKTLDYPGVQDDILNAAEKVFTYDPDRDAMVIKDKEQGVVFGKDGKNPKTVTEWLMEQQEHRRHWWGSTVGGGANGSKGGGSGFDKNPWSAEHWNLTKQGEVMRTRGQTVAESMAKAAGSRIGATRPVKS
jgi:hypothetical protein